MSHRIAMRAGRELRDKLRREGRHHDAEVLQQVIRSAEASHGNNMTLTHELRQLREVMKGFRPYLEAMSRQGEDNLWRPAKRHLETIDRFLV